MAVVIHDECLKNLFYAQETMKDWIPLCEYDIIFEATTKQETTDKVAKNVETSNKATGFVAKAIQAVIDLIKDIIKSITDLISGFTKGNDKQYGFDIMKEAMRADPKLKNKKVTVPDYKNDETEIDGLLALVEKNIKLVNANPDHSIDDLVKKVTEYTKVPLKSAAMIVTADLALKLADQDIVKAQALKELLDREESIMKELTKTLGKHDANKFKREIDAAAKNTWLHRLKVSLFRRKFNTVKDCLTGTYRTMVGAGFTDLKAISSEEQRLKKELRDGTIDKLEYNKKMEALKHDKKIAKKDARDSVGLAAKAVSNDNIKPVVKDVTKTVHDAKRFVKKEERKAKTAAKRAKRNAEYYANNNESYDSYGSWRK